MKYIVVIEHQSNYPNPIQFEKNESLPYGRKSIEFEGWIWVVTTDDNQGWAPIQYLQLQEESKTAVATQGYTAKELNTRVGDKLTLHCELNHWGWVERADGSFGWVPMNTIKTI